MSGDERDQAMDDALFGGPQISTDADGRHWDVEGREYRAVDVDGELTFEVIPAAVPASASLWPGPYEQEPEPAVVKSEPYRLLAEAVGGLELGAYDRRIVEWIVEYWDAGTITVLAGLIERARRAPAHRGRRP